MKCDVHSKATAGLWQVLVVSLVNSNELNWKIHIHRSVGRIVLYLIKHFVPLSSVVLQHHLSWIYCNIGTL